MINFAEQILRCTNFIFDDRGYYFPQLFQNPEQYLTWKDVEICANNPAFYEFELIDHNQDKVNIPRNERAWITEKTVQHHQHIVNQINHGHSAIIMNYGFHNRATQELLQVFEKNWNVDCAIHVYAGLTGSKSFKIHDDYPCNFIIQVEGKTDWRIYKNRISALYHTGYQQSILRHEDLELDLEVTLTPGDALYIPSRAYHCAAPQEKRLSMSIPCWPRMPNAQSFTFDRNYYRLNYEQC